MYIPSCLYYINSRHTLFIHIRIKTAYIFYMIMCSRSDYSRKEKYPFKKSLHKKVQNFRKLDKTDYINFWIRRMKNLNFLI